MEQNPQLVQELAALLPKEADAEAFLAAVDDRFPQAAAYLNARLALTEAFLHRCAMEELAALAERLLDRPIAVFDLGNSPIVMGPRFRAARADPVVAEFQERSFISGDFARVNQFKVFAQALARNNAPFTFTFREDGAEGAILPRRVHKLYIGGVYMAHCTMLLERELTDQDDRVLAHYCRLVCQQLEHSAYRPYQGDFENAILRGLLDGRYQSEFELKDRLELEGWRLYHNFYLLNVPRRKRQSFPDPASMQFPALLFQGVQLRLPRTASIHRYVESDRILLLIDLKDPAEEKKMKDTLHLFFREQDLPAAISRRFTDLISFREQTNFTEFLLRMAAGAALSAGLLDDHKLYFRRIAYYLRDLPVQSLCSPTLYELCTGDQGHELVDTALVYLDERRNVQRTADRLLLHRNTVMRRLARFQEITHLDLEGGEDTCRFYLAAQLLAYSAPGQGTA